MPPLAKIIEPRWERRKDARPGELATAALELFVEKGFSATRLDDVAKRAGVSKGTLYLYFDSKEDLFKAVVREGIVLRIAEAEERVRNYQGSTAAMIRELVHDWWNQIGATRLGGITKLMMSEAGNFPELAKFYHDEVVVRGTALFATAIQRGISSGEFRNVPLEFAPRIACAPVLMLMLWRNSFDLCDTHLMDPQAYLDAHTDMLLHALEMPVPAGKSSPRSKP
ncbi:MAG TPA: TetR/AcrR family transcriptional regulator [Usitatibacteraceae bacterium]